jgi:hypothetical protein
MMFIDTPKNQKEPPDRKLSYVKVRQRATREEGPSTEAPLQTEGCFIVAETVLYSNRQLANLERVTGPCYNAVPNDHFCFFVE